MKKLTDKMLERYYDGELSPRQTKKVEAALAEQPESRHALDKLSKMSELIHLANQESVDAVSFDGFADQVTKGLARDQQLPLTERITVWLREIFAHRPTVWVPAAAVVGTGLAVMLALPFTSAPPGTAPVEPAQPDIWIASTLPPATGSSSVDAVDYGTGSGMIYTVADGRGATATVVWVIEGN